MQDIESLEAINQDELVRQLVEAVGADAELDAETRATVLELARNETFLLVCEDYLRATAYLH